jgi:hypothetical protein
VRGLVTEMVRAGRGRFAILGRHRMTRCPAHAASSLNQVADQLPQEPAIFARGPQQHPDQFSGLAIQAPPRRYPEVLRPCRSALEKLAEANPER